MAALGICLLQVAFNVLTAQQVISGVIKWCWNRIHGGVVGWDSYELFKVGEQGMRETGANAGH